MDKCSNCGKNKVFLEGLCKKCYNEKNPLVVSFKPVKILVCFGCKKYFLKGKWTRFSKTEDMVKKVLQDRIIFNEKADISSFKIQTIIPKHSIGHNVKVDFRAVLTVFGVYKGVSKPIKEEYELKSRIIYILCPKCSKFKSGYFEGILQLRNVDEDVINYALEKLKQSEKRGIFLSKKKKVKNGFDLYLTKKGYIHELAQELLKKFGGEKKASRKLFSRNKQTSRDIYRVNVLFRQSKFRKGDVISIDGEPFKVSDITSRIKIKSLKTGNINTVFLKDLGVNSTEEIKETVVSSVFPDIKVINPYTFQQEKPMNPKNIKAEINQKVNVVVVDERIWIV
ncbi:MAG: NMD3-related protein [Candidatus Nanoarchaeia archaeon]|nr:NMD3-related protein [Candidatus Nanoarchaeia archaeon]